MRVAVVGLGKMGISHLSILRGLPDVEVVAVCDSSAYLLGVLSKFTGLRTYTSLESMLAEQALDAVVIATPSKLHEPMVGTALEAGVAVFCEKPFCLDTTEGARLVSLAREKHLVTQVGYHNRFVGAFAEVKRLVDLGAIGEVTHGLAEAYGPVVLKPQGGTWRSLKSEGGGCLYDYAAHPLNLVNWYLGAPEGVGGTVLHSVFSREIDDQVASTMYYSGGRSVQLSVNWSDESVRKMTTRITLWGTGGRIFADRQEVQVYLREETAIPEGYTPGWGIRYTTGLTEPVAFYLRGEEYSAQLEHFVDRVREGRTEGTNTFTAAMETDECIDLMLTDAAKVPTTRTSAETMASLESRVTCVDRLRRLLRRPGRRRTRTIPRGVK